MSSVLKEPFIKITCYYLLIGVTNMVSRRPSLLLLAKRQCCIQMNAALKNKTCIQIWSPSIRIQLCSIQAFCITPFECLTCFGLDFWLLQRLQQFVSFSFFFFVSDCARMIDPHYSLIFYLNLGQSISFLLRNDDKPVAYLYDISDSMQAVHLPTWVDDVGWTVHSSRRTRTRTLSQRRRRNTESPRSY